MAAAYVQDVGFGNVAPGATFTFGSNVTVGNTIVIIHGWGYNGCPPSFTDNLGNTYTAKESGNTALIGRWIWIWTAPVTTGGACTVTLHGACSTAEGVIVEVSGLAANPYQTFTTHSNPSTSVNAGTITPTADGSYIAGYFFRPGGLSFSGFTAGSGFTKRDEFNGGSQALEDIVQGTAAAITVDGTVGASSAPYPVSGVAASFTATAGGGVTNTSRFFALF